MFKSYFFWRLYASFILVIVIAALTLFVFLNHYIQNNSILELEKDLLAQANFLKTISSPYIVENNTIELQNKIETLGKDLGSRLTVIDINGIVLADSDKNPEFINNHSDHPEIQQAIAEGTGQADRYSNSVDKNLRYFAMLLEHQGKPLGFIRVALPLIEIRNKQEQVASYIVFTCLFAAIIALFIGFYIAGNFVKQLAALTKSAEAFAQGDFQQRVYVKSNDELGALARSFNFMTANAFDRVKRITEDRNKLAAILSGLVEGVIAIDAQQNIIHINDAAARLLKISASATLGKSIWSTVHIVEVHEILRNIIVLGGVSHSQVRIHNETQDTVIDVYGAALDKTDNRYGAVLVLHDISELEKLETVRRDFVINASHELKTPLTAIRGVLETVMSDREIDQETLWRFLAKAQSQTDRLVNIVSDLMALSRMESGKELNFDPVSLKAVLNQSLKSFKPISLEKNLRLSCNFDDSSPSNLDKKLLDDSLRVLGDAHLLGQLFDNLIDNAIKYTKAGAEVQVLIHATINATNPAFENFLMVEIKDSGVGLSKMDQQRVFERFYRVDKGRTRELGGTGLGLSICKHIVEQHRGYIEVRSELGKGSSFKVFLPKL